jgi:hypothetical protein
MAEQGLGRRRWGLARTARGRSDSEARWVVAFSHFVSAVALAAPRVAAEAGGEEVVADLRDLRRLLRAYGESDDLPRS